MNVCAGDPVQRRPFVPCLASILALRVYSPHVASVVAHLPPRRTLYIILKLVCGCSEGYTAFAAAES